MVGGDNIRRIVSELSFLMAAGSGLGDRACRHFKNTGDLRSETRLFVSAGATFNRDLSVATDYRIIIADMQAGSGRSFVVHPTQTSPATLLARRIGQEFGDLISGWNRSVVEATAGDGAPVGEQGMPYCVFFRNLGDLLICARMEFTSPHKPPEQRVAQLAVRPDGTTQAFVVPAPKPGLGSL